MASLRLVMVIVGPSLGCDGARPPRGALAHYISGGGRLKEVAVSGERREAREMGAEGGLG